jgi:hypothetical protein
MREDVVLFQGTRQTHPVRGRRLMAAAFRVLSAVEKP